jgi:hypothetical protein
MSDIGMVVRRPDEGNKAVLHDDTEARENDNLRVDVDDGGEKSKAPLLAKDARNGVARLYNHVNPADGLYGHSDDPLEIPAL